MRLLDAITRLIFQRTSQPKDVSLSLIPAGADRHPGGDPQHSRPIAIVEAKAIGGIDGLPSVNDGVVALTPIPGERVRVLIVADGNLDTQAFRLG